MFAERLNAAIKASGLSIAAFSRALGIPLRNVENWKSGKNAPPEWAQRMILKEAAALAK